MERVKILLVHNEQVTCALLRDSLERQGYEVSISLTGKNALKMFKENSYAIVILQLKMPDTHGLTMLKSIKRLNCESVVIVISNNPSFDSVRDALNSGAYDHIVVPFNFEELSYIVKGAIRFRELFIMNKNLRQELKNRDSLLKKEQMTLEKEGIEKVKQMDKLYKNLQDTYMQTIKTLIQAIDARDHITHSHSEKVSKYAVAIAKELRLNQKEIEAIREACALHDLGKIGIHDHILNKPSKLTKKEWHEIKLHSLKGAQILAPLGFLDGVIDLIRQHHERFDGKGYPDGRKAESIPLGARIMAAADAYDAMTSPRPYRKKAFTKRKAIAELKKNSGTQFDPKIVNAFLKVLRKA